MSTTAKNVGFAVAVLVMVLLLVRLFVAIQEDHDRWVAWCGQQGGHVADHTDTRVGYGTDSKGNFVTTTSSSTTYYCLSETGGIVDIR